LEAGGDDSDHVAGHEHPAEGFSGFFWLLLFLFLDACLDGSLFLLIDFDPIDEDHA
jgi:hypothetical protein